MFSFVTHLKHIHFNYIYLFIYLIVRGWICLCMHLSEDHLRELVLSFHRYVLGIQFSSSDMAARTVNSLSHLARPVSQSRKMAKVRYLIRFIWLIKNPTLSLHPPQQG